MVWDQVILCDTLTSFDYIFIVITVNNIILSG